MLSSTDSSKDWRWLSPHSWCNLSLQNREEMQTTSSQRLGPVCSALDYCPKAGLGRGTEISTSELVTDLNFLNFKLGRDHCGGDAYSGLESQCLQCSHPSSCCCVTLSKISWGKSCALNPAHLAWCARARLLDGESALGICWLLRALAMTTKNLGCLLVPAPAPVSCLAGSSFVC